MNRGFGLARAGLLAALPALAIIVTLGTGCPSGSAGNPPKSASTGGVAEAPAPKTAKKGIVRIEWTSFYQERISRFEIYRGPTATGPWERVSSDEDLIQGEGNLDVRKGDEPVEYAFEDRSLDVGEGAYYLIGKVDFLDRRSPHLRRALFFRAKDPDAKEAEESAATDQYTIAPPVGRLSPGTDPSSADQAMASDDDATTSVPLLDMVPTAMATFGSTDAAEVEP